MQPDQPAPPSATRRTTIRVRYAETDQMGFAHHAAYVVWLEAARIDWLAQVGLQYRAIEATGILMPVVELQMRYRVPLGFDDQIDLDTVGERLGPSRFAFTTTITRDGQPIAEGRVVVAAINRAGRPVRLPAGLP